MSSLKTSTTKTTKKANYECGTCSCGCQPNQCRCQEKNCQCGCGKPSAR